VKHRDEPFDVGDLIYHIEDRHAGKDILGVIIGFVRWAHCEGLHARVIFQDKILVERRAVTDLRHYSENR